jgi:WhiB family redox-sensing transcriptional regulator
MLSRHSPRRGESPTVAPGHWRSHAACRDADASVFFSTDGERGHARAHRESQAREICRTCPVLDDCREHALTADVPYGVWGGTTESDRRGARRRRRWAH